MKRDGTKEKPGKQIMSEMNTIITKAATVQGKSDSKKGSSVRVSSSNLGPLKYGTTRVINTNQESLGDMDDSTGGPYKWFSATR